MPSFFQLPAAVPWWLLLIAIIPVALYALLFLAVPFSVFGLKGRIDALEARLEDMHADIRSVALLHAASTRDEGPALAPPPIPPARSGADQGPVRRGPPTPASRSEPRLDWPK